MKQRDFIITVGNITGLSNAVVREVLETAGDVCADALHQADEEIVNVPGFGKFEPYDLTIDSKDPSTGEIQPRRRRFANFEPSKRFRAMVATGTPL